jgi:endonuclease YncB( thermonuclease family)
MRRTLTVLVAAVALAVAGCGYSGGPPATDLTPAAEAEPEQTPTATVEPEQTTTATVAVVSVADGDTVDVSSGETVRLIGIDAPEVGECGHQPAADRLTELVLRKEVTLVPGARDDVDRYGRLLRYVDVGSDDAGAQLLRQGLAVPRYDSIDGYGGHHREASYYAEAVAPAPCESDPEPAPEPEPEAGPEVWNLPGPDLDCSDIGHPVTITGPDYHGLDADGDGIGCEG